ncbi:MAG: helix-turn-helix domain-containing protein [Dehalococcoidales bacterium]|nr:helix-turn-helix domain-containing protein [Dehalococcoidales bacterium]
MAVKSRIHQARIDAKYTQGELAESAGISRQAYTAIESGKSVPSTEVALRLARTLKSTVEDLFWLEDTPGKIIRAELAGEDESVPEGTRVQIVNFGSRVVARPLNKGSVVSHIFNPADAVAITSHGNRQASFRLLNRAAGKLPSLVMAGSDPSASILGSMLRDLDVRLILLEEESMPALHSLARGEVHIAGCNFKDRITGVYNTPLVREIVPFPCTIIRFAVWRQGMLVSAGNPKSISHIDDLIRPNISFINRHPGAGSRGLLNRLLWESGIPAGSIYGYDRMVNGHLATAETVAAGLADCGIGIEAAARATELDFLLLSEEPYDLVIPNHYLELPAVQSLLDLLKLGDFRRQVESLGGYDTSEMGNSQN